MTYVLGIRRFGTTAIISESLLTSKIWPPNVGSIKSGILFPGCTYGICGTWDRARRFLQAARAKCTQRSLDERIDALGELVAGYPFPPKEFAFSVLFSFGINRLNSIPAFYLLDSNTERIHPVIGDVITLGTGKRELDELVYPYADTLGSEERLDQILRVGADGGHAVSHEDFAYLYAFLIFQRTYGDAGRGLAAEKAGGFVHFVFQNAEGERRQKPRVFVVGKCHEGGRLVEIMAERLAFDRDPELGDVIAITQFGVGSKPRLMGLIVQDDSGALKHIEDTEARLAPIWSRQDSAPLYHILIAGGLDHTQRGSPAGPYKILLDQWSGSPAVGLDGKMSPHLLQFLQDST
jgi:hypothetical protein